MRHIVNFLVTRRFNKQIDLINKVGILACVAYFNPSRGTCDHG